jgi:hypothetical protein
MPQKHQSDAQIRMLWYFALEYSISFACAESIDFTAF